MLRDDGMIDFTSELVNALHQAMESYVACIGQPADALERGLTLTYLLGLMRCDLDALWETLADQQVFGQLDPRQVYAECVAADSALGVARRQRIAEELVRRGMLAAQD
jgi:hypothetical protein